MRTFLLPPRKQEKHSVVRGEEGGKDGGPVFGRQWCFPFRRKRGRKGLGSMLWAKVGEGRGKRLSIHR